VAANSQIGYLINFCTHKNYGCIRFAGVSEKSFWIIPEAGIQDSRSAYCRIPFFGYGRRQRFPDCSKTSEEIIMSAVEIIMLAILLIPAVVIVMDDGNFERKK
jgi:hypothetical protein